MDKAVQQSLTGPKLPKYMYMHVYIYNLVYTIPCFQHKEYLLVLEAQVTVFNGQEVTDCLHFTQHLHTVLTATALIILTSIPQSEQMIVSQIQ